MGLIEPLLPVSTGKRGGQYREHRIVVEAIAWKYCTGAPWRDLPDRFGPWQTAWKRHATWSRTARGIGCGASCRHRRTPTVTWTWLIAIDSSIARCTNTPRRCRASRPRGATLNRRFPALEPPERAIGRSRGGLTTKVHMACDGQGRPMSLWLTGGHVNDVTELPAAMAGIRVPRVGSGRPRSRPDRLIGDKGYSSRGNRKLLAACGIKVTIPEKDNQAATDVAAGPRAATRTRSIQHVQEPQRGRARLQPVHWRGLVSRYDKTALCYLGGLPLASLLR